MNISTDELVIEEDDEDYTIQVSKKIFDNELGE